MDFAAQVITRSPPLTAFDKNISDVFLAGYLYFTVVQKKYLNEATFSSPAFNEKQTEIGIANHKQEIGMCL